MPRGIVWRHNQAGDLPGIDNVNIDATKLLQLVESNKGRKGFTYTHYPVIDNNWNQGLIKNANKLGFTINLSAESYSEADKALLARFSAKALDRDPLKSMRVD